MSEGYPFLLIFDAKWVMVYCQLKSACPLCNQHGSRSDLSQLVYDEVKQMTTLEAS
jgi:hypothetical protein